MLFTLVIDYSYHNILIRYRYTFLYKKRNNKQHKITLFKCIVKLCIVFKKFIKTRIEQVNILKLYIIH